MEDSKYRQGKLGQFIYWIINHFFYFLPILWSNRKFRRSLFIPLYAKKKHECENSHESNIQISAGHDKTIIYMVQPETTFSGGLSDRLRAIVSIYDECKRRGLPFKIVFEPLHLQDYLQPNSYNWVINDKEIIWDTNKCYPCTLLTYHHNLNNPLQKWAQRCILKYYIRKNYEQIHVYSNMATEDNRFGALFHELFKPSNDLQNYIDEHLLRLGGDRRYIAMTFRFRQLLGDFKEGGETLPQNSRESYINRCIASIERLHGKHSEERILVTSDSSTFLNRLLKDVRTKDYVYIIPGQVVHIGFTFDAHKETYMKSFVDFFMLGHAKQIFLMRDKKMYHSGFPYRASLLYGSKYSEIYI